MDYTAHEADADACLAFHDHAPTEGEVTASNVKFDEKEKRFHVEVEGRFANNSLWKGTVFIDSNRRYALCIRTVIKENLILFPHSWHYGWIN
jgi:hypothetical protein